MCDVKREERGGDQNLSRNGQDRVFAAERVLDVFLGVRIGQPLAIDDKEVFVATWLDSKVPYPAAISDLDQGSPFGLPIIERPGNGNLLCARSHEFQRNGGLQSRFRRW